MKLLKFWGACLCLVLICVGASGQFLPNNTSLSAQSVARWMQSNRAMTEIVQVVDTMHVSVESSVAFEALSPSEQDVQINHYLQERQLLIKAQQLCQTFGWKSIGEFMRLGTKLGNAIAAYFVLGNLDGLSEEQQEALRNATDPAVLAVPKGDIAFIRANETMLQQYIRGYAAGP